MTTALAARLQPLYSKFDVANRLLFTGHSHQAWPDVARAALLEAFDDAALHVDDKWGKAFAKAERVRIGYRKWLGMPTAEIALFQNTFDALVSWLSAMPLQQRPHLVTTDGEFHSLRRLLARLEEAGVRIDRIAAHPVETLAERYSQHLHTLDKAGQRPAAAFCSTVLFETGHIVPHVPALAQAARTTGVPLLLDTYHHLAALPFDPSGLDDVYIVGGGYKYCQLGEGNGFLRVPNQTELRPIVTGWFAEFRWLNQPVHARPVPYGEGAERFFGATYDPISHYRAASVFDFFDIQELSASLLREQSLRQINHMMMRLKTHPLLAAHFALDSYDPITRGGFLALHTTHATRLKELLATRGVLTDSRGMSLRLGPAPYTTDAQLDAAIDHLIACAEPLIG